jgi:hypothetical protein
MGVKIGNYRLGAILGALFYKHCKMFVKAQNFNSNI